jgi:hypothetical protein
MALYPGTWAAESIKLGLSANQGLKQFRDSGGHVGRSAWLALRAEAGAALANRPEEMAANLNSVPTNIDTLRFQNGTKTGFLHQVELLIRTKGTDVVTNRPFSVRSNTLMTRAEAIQSALDTLAQNAANDKYEEQVVLGGVYVGTYQLVPGLPE